VTNNRGVKNKKKHKNKTRNRCKLTLDRGGVGDRDEERDVRMERVANFSRFGGGRGIRGGVSDEVWDSLQKERNRVSEFSKWDKEAMQGKADGIRIFNRLRKRIPPSDAL